MRQKTEQDGQELTYMGARVAVTKEGVLLVGKFQIGEYKEAANEKRSALDGLIAYNGDHPEKYMVEGDGEKPRTSKGKERSSIENASIIIGSANVAPSTIQMGVELIRQTANYTDDIAKVGKIAGRATKGFGVSNMLITVVDGRLNGWQNHHTADLVIGGAQMVLLGSGPVGWGIGLIWVTADFITIGTTGKSITENIFDP